MRGILNRPVAMPPSSLEDRVRELCAQAVAAKTEAELGVVLPLLQAAIHDHIRFVRALAVDGRSDATTLRRRSFNCLVRGRISVRQRTDKIIILCIALRASMSSQLASQQEDAKHGYHLPL